MTSDWRQASLFEKVTQTSDSDASHAGPKESAAKMPDGPSRSPSVRLEQARRFNAFVLRYRRPLLQYFRRRGLASEDAEDLTQAAFLKLMHKVQAEDGVISDAYVFSAASSALVDHYRRNNANPTRTMVELDPEMASGDPGADKILEDRQALHVMLERLNRIRGKWRTAFILHRFDSLSHGEIAKRMGISISSVEKYIMMVLAELKTPADRDPS